MRLVSFLSGVSLALAGVQGAHAAPPERPVIVDTAQLITAFEKICLDHVRDPGARAGFAQAAPWSMKPVPGEAAGFFMANAIQLHIVDADAQCAVTSRIDDAATLESVATAAAGLMPRDAAQPGVSSDTLMWAVNDKSGGKFGIGLKVSNRSGINLATFNIQNLGPAQ